MAAKYSRLPTSDDCDRDSVAFDFTSYNTYGSSRYTAEKYKSIFVYGDKGSHMKDSDVTVSVGKLLKP